MAERKAVAVPDLELSGGRGGGGGFCLLAMPPFLPSVIFFNRSTGGGGGPPCPSARSVTAKVMVTSQFM